MLIRVTKAVSVMDKLVNDDYFAPAVPPIRSWIPLIRTKDTAQI